MQEERDDIEKFFAKRLGEKEFPFEEEQWDVLAKRLDDASPVRVPFWVRFRKRFGYILIPIITFLIGWYWHSETQKDQSLDTEPIKTTIESPAMPNQGNTDNKSVIEEVPNDSAEQLNDEPEALQPSTNSEQVVKEVKTTQQFVSQQAAVEREKVVEKQGSGIPPIGTRSLKYYEIAPLHLMELDFPLAEINGGIAVPVADSIQSESDDEFKPIWSVTLLAAPDFSSTNMKDLYNSLGQTVGLQFSRATRENFQWNFGLLLNNKIYTAGKGEYSPASGYYGRGVEPDLTDARCLVLEIPVSMGMRLFKTNRGSVWANLGVSSFVFLTEKYSYFYDVYDPNLATGWEGKTENTHIAAAVGLSFIYAHQLSERSSLIFEPYFKSTIQPVGHGNVDLLSSGLNVGFNYKLFSKN